MSETPDISFDDDAARDISEADLQRLHEQGHQVEDVEKEVEEIQTDPGTNVHEVIGDDFIEVERHGHKVAIGIDREELLSQMGGPPPGGGGGGGGDVPFEVFFRIDLQTPTATNDARNNPVAWTYAVTQVRKAVDGYGVEKWTEVPGGYVGLARNLCEATNTGVGIQGNGVNHDGADYPDGFAMVPIYGIVRGFFVVTNEGVLEGWFDRVNSEDGLCSGSSSSDS